MFLTAVLVAKRLSAALFAAGIGVAVSAREPADRWRAASREGLVALVLSWSLGHIALVASGKTLADPVVAWGVAASLAAWALALDAALHGRGISGRLAVAATAATIAAMVLRSHDFATTAAGVGLAALVSLGFGGLTAAAHPDPKSATFSLVVHLGHAEGLSLLTLLGATFLRRGLGMDVPIAPWLGWVHGALFLTYVVALSFAARAIGWNVRQLFIAGLGAVLPFGPWWSERHLRPAG